ncbi:MAG: ComEC/Rec2 family competence protein [Flammeovirgaceae bacterium]
MVFHLLAGIVFFLIFRQEIELLSYVTTSLFVFYVVLNFSLTPHFRLRWRWLLGAVYAFFLVSLGYLLAQNKTEKFHPTHLYNFSSLVTHYECIINDELEHTGIYAKTYAKITKVKDSLGWHYAKGKVMIYFPFDAINSLKYGDKVLIVGKPELVSKQLNPEEFAFDVYLSNKQVYHQDFLKGGEYLKIGEGFGNDFIRLSYQIGNYCKNVFKNYISENREQTVALALVVGIKENISDETLKTYSETGAMHILAVSGLHVGILYKVLELIFAKLRRKPKGKMTFYVFSFSFLWIYAFVTGLSASVLRAVVMFSFVIFGNLMNKKGNIYNTMAASAFLLLCYDPFLLLDIGFQLSYMAVLGIIYLQPKLDRLWLPENRITYYIWQTVTVSVAAQISTLPLVLSYFHQFPTYFLITNVLVIPLSWLVLQVGLGLILFSGILDSWLGQNWFTNFFAVCLEKMVFGINEFLGFIQKLPLSVIDGFYLTSNEAILLYICFLTCVIAFHWRKVSFLFISSVLFLYLMITKSIFLYEHSSQKIFAVYHSKKNSTISFTKGYQTKLINYADKSIETVKMRERLENFLVKNAINRVDVLENLPQEVPFKLLENNAILMVFEGKKILWLRTNPIRLPLEVDYLIVSNNAIKHWEEIQPIHFQKAILDGTNQHHVIKRLEKEGKEQNLSLHSTSTNGAFLDYFEKN